MFFCIIQDNGELDARDLPHTYGDHPSRPFMWHPEIPHNPFWKQWEQQSSKDEIDPHDGVVVVNFKTRWLGSVQTYSSVLCHAPHPNGYSFELDVDDRQSDCMQEIKQLWDDRRFSEYFVRSTEELGLFNFNPKRHNYSPEECCDFNAFVQSLKRQQLYPNAVIQLPVDPPTGWQFEEWSDPEDGYTRLLQEIATHTNASFQRFRSWADVVPNAQHIFDVIQAQRQKDLLLAHVEHPTTDCKKRM